MTKSYTIRWSVNEFAQGSQGDLFMEKIRQVTDNIHGTVYLSTLESELISTPYFYRLHDIYQSSTVYMTYPSNRTKRYEHSLGTMELASSMLFSAVSNADNFTRNKLFEKLHIYLSDIVEKAIEQSNGQVAPYFEKCREKMDAIFDKFSYKQDETTDFTDWIASCIEDAIGKGIFSDSALDNFQFYPMEIKETNTKDSIENLFLYRCLLQAVRIVALFHDVGHPPYSHIIETVLDQLYKECYDDNNEWAKRKRDEFKRAMNPYASDKEELAYKCRTFYCDSSLVDSALHERIGLSLLQSTLNDVIPNFLIKVADSPLNYSCKIASIIYYIVVVEFVTAILTEKDIVFKSFHKIVDGVLDADRFDYIMRDSLNSGVDWGKIPYKRIINSAKLIYLDMKDDDNSPFVVAYPKKVSDDIVDLLLTRYKIFARINFHHRCMKTTVALQSCVLELARDYLKSSGKSSANGLCPEINILWSALTMKIGDRRMRIIQWNDSWLICVLHRAVGKLMAGADEGKYKVLRENLEEILLNKKRYHSLIKRGADCQRFIKKVFEYAKITEHDLIALREHEYEKYYKTKGTEENITDDKILELPIADAVDSINRIDEMLQVLENGDLELLNSLMPLQQLCVNDALQVSLERDKNKGLIADYKTIVNYGRGKTGLPKHEDVLEEIYLYDETQCTLFDERVTLKPQIKAIEKTVPWIYVYFVPPKGNIDIKELSNTVFNDMAQEVGKSLSSRYIELFGTRNENPEAGMK